MIKNKMIHDYQSREPSVLNTFRTLILYGKNSATYKFAFCHSLLLQKPQVHISYESLTEEFLKELYKHYKKNPNQFQSGKNRLTEAMDTFMNHGETEFAWEQLVNVAKKIIYNHVFDAFQNVGGGSIDSSYKLFEHDVKSRQLVLTDNALSLMENKEHVGIVLNENYARWGIVETAWYGGISPNLIDFNQETGDLISTKGNTRVNLRSAVNALLPYQKGRCFYCSRLVSTGVGVHEDSFADVDHYFSHAMLQRLRILNQNIDPKINFNGVWNLVIACRACNRGIDGKSARRAHDKYKSEIVKRNKLMLEEHNHCLKHGIKTGFNVNSGQQMIQKMHQLFQIFDIFPSWEPQQVFDIREFS